MVIDVPTPHGPARVHLETVDQPRGILVLGHGAGGGVRAPDLATAAGVATSLGVSAALVEQPYRVAARRGPAPPPHRNTAGDAGGGRRAAAARGKWSIVTGGRSSGARVACRTAAATGADAVLCLAFPLEPPRRQGRPPSPSRLPELDAVTVPTLVVQGERDRFGIPPEGSLRNVAVVRGDHALRSDQSAVREVVRNWLSRLLGDAD